jgi:hypothetical protein
MDLFQQMTLAHAVLAEQQQGALVRGLREGGYRREGFGSTDRLHRSALLASSSPGLSRNRPMSERMWWWMCMFLPFQ